MYVCAPTDTAHVRLREGGGKRGLRQSCEDLMNKIRQIGKKLKIHHLECCIAKYLHLIRFLLSLVSISARSRRYSLQMDIQAATFFAASISFGLYTASLTKKRISSNRNTFNSENTDVKKGSSGAVGVSPEIKAEMLSRICSFFGEEKFNHIQVSDICVCMNIMNIFESDSTSWRHIRQCMCLISENHSYCTFLTTPTPLPVPLSLITYHLLPITNLTHHKSCPNVGLTSICLYQ